MIRGWGDLMVGGGGGGRGGHFGGMDMNSMRRFEEQYHCYSVAFADKAHLEKGDKILLPPSAFDMLARLQVDYPMLFKLAVKGTTDLDGNDIAGRTTHCGVLEFTAEEGCCYIPFWMMQNLLIEEGALVTVTNVSLPKATFVKLQPQSVDFLEISNPRAVLEHALRNYSCVTLNDIIQIQYNNKNYHFALKEVTPSPAACIIETDCNVDFDAPVGYVEPERMSRTNSTSDARSSSCPSPATTSASFNGDPNSTDNVDLDDNSKQKTPGIRIVNGQIVRPDEYDEQQQQNRPSGANGIVPTTMLAEKIGATGIQKNAAIPDSAPEVHYWAIQAGDGARLDGKQVTTPLKDASGNEINIRQVRAEAAQRRLQQLENEINKKLPSTGKTLQGELFQTTTKTSSSSTGNGSSSSQAAATTTTASSSSSSSSNGVVRTSRIGSKYSKLKATASAFNGTSNNMDNNKK